MDLLGDNWKEKDMPDLTGKVILVTGGTDGLGLAACKQLAIHNAHVVFTYRNQDKLKMCVMPSPCPTYHRHMQLVLTTL